MQGKLKYSRRDSLKLGVGALMLTPVAVFATKNEAMRTSTKYQDFPDGNKQCAGCAQFIPGTPPKGAGGCKIFPGDTEVAPTGYCIAWAKAA